jgi:ferredoxin-NADP reductase
MVKKYSAEVVSVIHPVDNIYTVELRSLSGRFRFHPGQFLHLALDEYDPSAAWPDSRCFSIQTPPSDETLKITFATKGAFTHRMKNELSAGRLVTLKLPYGQIFQQEFQKDNVVFIAGGTGITPFLSLFLDEEFKDFNNPKLYFGLRNRSMNVYGNELQEASEINPSLSLYLSYEDTEGMLDIGRIFSENSTASTYFISGPQPMITAFRSFLSQNDVPANHIISDDWE